MDDDMSPEELITDSYRELAPRMLVSRLDV